MFKGERCRFPGTRQRRHGCRCWGAAAAARWRPGPAAHLGVQRPQGWFKSRSAFRALSRAAGACYRGSRSAHTPCPGPLPPLRAARALRWGRRVRSWRWRLSALGSRLLLPRPCRAGLRAAFAEFRHRRAAVVSVMSNIVAFVISLFQMVSTCACVWVISFKGNTHLPKMSFSCPPVLQMSPGEQ